MKKPTKIQEMQITINCLRERIDTLEHQVIDLQESNTHKRGDVAIIPFEGGYLVKEHDGYSWLSVGCYCFTLWGAKRLWRRLYGESKGVPMLKS